MFRDDDDRLTRYVLDYFRHLCTELEKDTLRAAGLQIKEEQSSHPIIEAKLREARELTRRPEIRAALDGGVDAARRSIRDRLMRDHADSIHLNRCPICDELCRTPMARMCVHCGHAWHEGANQK